MNTQRSGQSGKSKCSARSEMEIPGGLWSIECHEAWGYEALSLPPDRTPLASEQRQQHDLKKLSCFSYHHQDFFFFLNPTHHSRVQPFDPGREKTGLKFTDCPPVFVWRGHGAGFQGVFGVLALQSIFRFPVGFYLGTWGWRFPSAVAIHCCFPRRFPPPFLHRTFTQTRHIGETLESRPPFLFPTTQNSTTIRPTF